MFRPTFIPVHVKSETAFDPKRKLVEPPRTPYFVSLKTTPRTYRKGPETHARLLTCAQCNEYVSLNRMPTKTCAFCYDIPNFLNNLKAAQNGPQFFGVVHDPRESVEVNVSAQIAGVVENDTYGESFNLANVNL
jgi:hypothetical protein